ncbi:molybdate ABC transporter substrate-binding protein [Nitratireductor pacificus]|uniref:Molybdenum ABC transporter periplasmic molybdenum-binding protein n=1 Tax=Nitratireductor pacificus pht-3B TaxID=391937 RepID=K2LGV6_9HYPH|nr:molybdate ABC transporter substrate-binding protein [Nitratireductor pacificus]EKF17019.1 molybdenum ABC transporter periplasmic molybdenum-binding protein [Nitratireductor pacificus pht-3B]
MFKRALATFAFLAALSTLASAADRLTLFAAASMKDAMDRAVVTYGAAGGGDVVVSFASSSVLARQIEAGAPADLFISANKDWMDYLSERDLVRSGSERVIAGNSLVIAAAEGTEPVSDPELLLDTRFAMGDPSHVPAGKYAKTALESLGLWSKLEKNAVFGENVRVALELANRGEVKAAIVYGSDQKAAGGLARAYTFPSGSHAPVIYPAAAMKDASPEAEAFLDFLTSEAGQAIFAELGFSPAAE